MPRSNLGLNVRIDERKSRHRSILMGTFSGGRRSHARHASLIEIASWKYYSITREFSSDPAAHVAMISSF